MRLFIFFFSLLVFASCNNNSNQSGDNDLRLREMPEDASEATMEELNKQEFYIWQIDSDQKTIKKNPKFREQYLNADTLILGLNENFPGIHIEKVKHSLDTLYTRISNAEYLTERMGSYGSENYIAHAVLNLGSAKGVRYVRIDFEEGSHASPGIWTKEDFQAYKETQ